MQKQKYIYIGLTIWIILQTPRLIALPIIQDVLAGVDESAWMYPAMLDIVVACLSPWAIIVLWKKRNVYGWTFLIVYFIISIIDHGNAITASSLARVPQTFAKMGISEATSTPLCQTFVDIFCIVLLCLKQIKKEFKINV